MYRRRMSTIDSSSPSVSSPSIFTPTKPTALRDQSIDDSGSLGSSKSDSSYKDGNSNNKDRDSKLQNTRHRLVYEYQKLQELSIKGLYVIPSFTSIFEWHCVLFIRNRVYRSSVIRFVIIIPDDFPEECPVVKFQTPVFHPLIGMDGEFDLTHHFHDWKPEKYMIGHILCYIKNVFHNPDKYNYPALNPEAEKLLKENYEEYLRKVSHFVKLSIQNVYNNPQHTPIVFAEEWKDKEKFEATKRQILKKDSPTIVDSFKAFFTRK
ncbi:hypothetical protein DFA_12156 [Cavenderia fasciculata]|uniref:UBC core domain-containing protein n=1 Tax=Cavenderia fasciculata TaxID=261658 RepID=F4QCA3_CACFS|nr:uncharacterized protein DFA_12156 [Cavenderia fasciculata]EGG14384.1 hypothetical protein DFA_12156 [Cavenderia fasciculata]|eukprot:XP_004353793.1 hypothetical protein DFA_12156 [Cavenderia fasciculata]